MTNRRQVLPLLSLVGLAAMGVLFLPSSSDACSIEGNQHFALDQRQTYPESPASRWSAPRPLRAQPG